MAVAVSWTDADRRVIRSQSGRTLTRVSFMEPAALGEKAWKVEAGDAEPIDSPQALLGQFPTPEVIASHFHRIDQFQIAVEGGGRISRRRFDPVTVQYADRYTPYSIVPAQEGVSFFVLRAQADTGGYSMPKSRAMTVGRRGRSPVSRPVPPAHRPRSGVTVEELLGPEPDGMAAFMLRAAPGETVAGRSAAESSGQFCVITHGSAGFAGKEYPTWSVIWIDPAEDAPQFAAGAEGCDIVVTQFRRKPS